MKEQLDKMTDEQLKALIGDAEALLKKRDQEHKKQALEKIRALAEEAGVSIAVKEKVRPGRKSRKNVAKPSST